MQQFGREVEFYYLERFANYRKKRESPEAGFAVADNAFIEQTMQYAMSSGAGGEYLHMD